MINMNLKRDLKNMNMANMNLKTMDIEDMDLEPMDMRNMNLKNMNMENTDLKNMQMVNMNLRIVDMENMDLKTTNMENLNLKNITLKNMNLMKMNPHIEMFPKLNRALEILYTTFSCTEKVFSIPRNTGDVIRNKQNSNVKGFHSNGANTSHPMSFSSD